jgi:hypothetical protein
LRILVSGDGGGLLAGRDAVAVGFGRGGVGRGSFFPDLFDVFRADQAIEPRAGRNERGIDVSR